MNWAKASEEDIDLSKLNIDRLVLSNSYAIKANSTRIFLDYGQQVDHSYHEDKDEVYDCTILLHSSILPRILMPNTSLKITRAKVRIDWDWNSYGGYYPQKNHASQYLWIEVDHETVEKVVCSTSRKDFPLFSTLPGIQAALGSNLIFLSNSKVSP